MQLQITLVKVNTLIGMDSSFSFAPACFFSEQPTTIQRRVIHEQNQLTEPRKQQSASAT